MGGMVAQELVLSHPGRVRTLTLGCSFPGGPEAKMTDMEVVGMIAEAVLSGDGERAIRVGYEVMIAAEHAEDPANYDLYAEVAQQYPAPIPTLMAQLSAIVAHDTSERLADIEVPTLVVHGTADRLLESVNGELLARLIPGARLELLDGAGHMFIWEQPELSARLVRDHVAAAART
jgi:pimeloyl-ACP methyl ester carboxylesterase